jgi:chromosome segregation ATPase
MARLGINYSDVAAAAVKLTGEAKNVTVDSVRQVLGTGSKSTIAPLLKRWRAAHEDDTHIVPSGLPTHLLEAVTALNERIQADAGRRIQTETASHMATLANITLRLDASNAHSDALANELEQMTLQFADAQTRQENLKQQAHDLQLKNIKANADIVGLNDRLTDRTVEIEALRAHVSTARQQFEHYQQSVATQRSEDRQQHASQVSRLEHEIADLRTALATAQMRATQAETHLARNIEEQQTHHAEWDTLQKKHQHLLGENRVLANQAAVAADDKANLESQLHLAMTAQATAHANLAVAQHTEAEMRNRLAILEKRLATGELENRNLLQANAVLKGRLEEHATTKRRV